MISLKKNYNLYIKIFLSLVLCVVTTILILSTVLYINFDNIAMKQVYSYNLNSLTQTSKDVYNMTQTAKTLSLQIFSDLNISKLMYYTTLDVYDIGPTMSQLGSYSVSMPFIDSIYIYNARNGTFAVSSNNLGGNDGAVLNGIHYKGEFADKDIVKIIDSIDKYNPFYPIPRYFSLTNNYSCYSFLCYDTLSINRKYDGVVVVNISGNWIRDVMSIEAKSTENDTFIIDKYGLLVSDSSTDHITTDVSGKPYIQKILKDKKNSGYFINDVNNVKSFITYTEPDELGWRYIRITPCSIIFNDIDSMRYSLIFISLGILLLSLALSFFVSRKVSKPINRELGNLKKLELERRKRNRVLRQEYLSNLLQGNEICSLDMIQKSLDEFEVPISAAGKVLLVLLRIDDYSDFSRKYNHDDMNLYKFAISNIASELCSAYYRTEAVDMGEDRIILILNSIDNCEGLLDSKLNELLACVQSNVLLYLGLSLSITVSPQSDTFENVGLLYSQVLEASMHRLFRGYGSIIQSEEIMEYKSKEYCYPMQKEKLLVDAIMSGKIADAKKLYLDIINETNTYPYIIINFVISHLAFTIYNTINIIQKSNSMLTQSDFNTAVLSINNAEIIDKVNERFFRLFEDINLKLEEKKSLKYDNLIQNINNIIRVEYMKPDLCLNGIAKVLDMNPTYLGRFYKQHTLKTILDYITEVRMEKAREFLLKTGYSVAEISEKAGFTNSSYFYKTFKKENGITPNEFRRNASI